MTLLRGIEFNSPQRPRKQSLFLDHHTALTSPSRPPSKYAMSQPELPPIGHAVSGAIGASLSNTIVYPLDLIVTRLQTQKRTKNTSNAEVYTSILDAIEKIYNSEGISGFYSGWTQDTIANVSSTFFYHFAYQYLREKRLRRALLKGEKTLGIVEELLVGALAGVFSRFFTTPMSNLVTRKQTAGQNTPNGKVASSASILRDIYNEKGVTGFWSGYRSSILLTLNPSISYYLFELFKSSFPPNTISFRSSSHEAKIHTSLETFLFAAVSKSIASTVTYPFILAKARMQVSERRNLNPIRVLARIIHEEGWQGAFEGLPGQIVKGFWAQGFMLMFKERVGAMIIYLYLRLHRYRAKGGDIASLMEQGKHQGREYIHQAGQNIPESVINANASAKEILISTAEGLKGAVMNPGQTAGEAVEKVTDTIVGAAKSARDVLRGDSNGQEIKEAVKEAVDTAKGEVKGAIEQAKKK